MAALDTDIRYIKGVGEQRAKAMANLGIETLNDLVSFFPRAYDDRTDTKPISLLVPARPSACGPFAAAAPRLSHIRKGLDLVKVRSWRGGLARLHVFQPSS
jgi:ATP-dependent DNA helicase RecG